MRSEQPARGQCWQGSWPFCTHAAGKQSSAAAPSHPALFPTPLCCCCRLSHLNRCDLSSVMAVTTRACLPVAYLCSSKLEDTMAEAHKDTQAAGRHWQT